MIVNPPARSKCSSATPPGVLAPARVSFAILQHPIETVFSLQNSVPSARLSIAQTLENLWFADQTLIARGFVLQYSRLSALQYSAGVSRQVVVTTRFRFCMGQTKVLQNSAATNACQTHQHEAALNASPRHIAGHLRFYSKRWPNFSKKKMSGTPAA